MFMDMTIHSTGHWILISTNGIILHMSDNAFSRPRKPTQLIRNISLLMILTALTDFNNYNIWTVWDVICFSLPFLNGRNCHIYGNKESKPLGIRFLLYTFEMSISFSMMNPFRWRVWIVFYYEDTSINYTIHAFLSTTRKMLSSQYKL